MRKEVDPYSPYIGDGKSFLDQRPQYTYVDGNHPSFEGYLKDARSSRTRALPAEALQEIAYFKDMYNNAETDEQRRAANLGAEAVRNKYGFSGGADGSEYIPLASQYQYQDAGLMDAKTLAKQFGLEINAGKLEEIFNRATDAKYATKQREQAIAERSFANNLYDTGLAIQDATNKAMSESAVSGRAAGALAAQNMLNTQALQSESVMGATELANERLGMGASMGAERASNVVDAHTQSQQTRSALANLAAQIQGNEVMDNTARATYEGTRYSTDGQLDANVLSALLNTILGDKNVDALREGHLNQAETTNFANAVKGDTDTYGTQVADTSNIRTNETSITTTGMNNETQRAVAQINADAQLDATEKQVLSTMFQTREVTQEGVDAFVKWLGADLPDGAVGKLLTTAGFSGAGNYSPSTGGGGGDKTAADPTQPTAPGAFTPDEETILDKKQRIDDAFAKGDARAWWAATNAAQGITGDAPLSYEEASKQLYENVDFQRNHAANTYGVDVRPTNILYPDEYKARKKMNFFTAGEFYYRPDTGEMLYAVSDTEQKVVPKKK